MAERDPLTFLFLTSEFKGDACIRGVKAEGCRTVLLTEEKLRHAPWPHDSLDAVVFTPDLKRTTDVLNTVTYLARGWRFDQVLPLDEFELDLVALLREHMQLPGRGVSTTRVVRDKLAMRNAARATGLPVPAYIGVLTYDDLRAFMAATPAPWVLKPRSDAGSMGIRKCDTDEEVWRALDVLGDRQSYYLLEQFVPGAVYHVDALTVGRKPVFASVQRYGAPPLSVYQGGGIFTTRTLGRQTADAKALRALNQQVIDAMDLRDGASHAEFIRRDGDGQFVFLEIAARVGGAFISDMIAQASGVNLWREWGRLEVALLRGTPYTLPPTRADHAGMILTLARQQHPDTSAYTDPEIVWRVDKEQHAGLVVVSPDAKRVEALLANYLPRFQQDFHASATPHDAQRTGYTG